MSRARTAALLGLAGLFVAVEVAGALVDPRLWFAGHAVLLVVLVGTHLSASNRRSVGAGVGIALATASLLRLLSLSMPGADVSFAVRTAIVGAPLGLAVLLALRALAARPLSDGVTAQPSDGVDVGVASRPSDVIGVAPQTSVGVGVGVGVASRPSDGVDVAPRPSSRRWPVHLAVAALGLPLGALVYVLVGPDLPSVDHDALGTVGALASVALLGGVVQELLFRGLVHRAFRAAVAPWVALAASTAVFASMYAGTRSVPAVALAVLAGLLFGRLADLSGSVCGVAGAHALMNASALLAWPALGWLG